MNVRICLIGVVNMSQLLYLRPLERQYLKNDLENPCLPKKYKQRIWIILLTDEGKTQSEICETLGCSTETAKYWMSVTEQGQPEQCYTKPLGRPKKAGQEYLQRLEQLLQHNPQEFGFKSPYWKTRTLIKQLNKEFNITVSDRHINRLLQQRGLSLIPI